jgi:tRNA(fMet)-specific endonuclease VapC
MKLLLDTNIIINYVRNERFRKHFQKNYQIKGNTLITSVVVVGELESFALQPKWRESKQNDLKDILEDLIIFPIRIQQIINRYAEIDAFSQNKLTNKPLKMSARNMGKNDIWIAATASVYDMTLLTMDNDFEHLGGEFLEI